MDRQHPPLQRAVIPIRLIKRTCIYAQAIWFLHIETVLLSSSRPLAVAPRAILTVHFRQTQYLSANETANNVKLE